MTEDERDYELLELRNENAMLRDQLAKAMDRIAKLEERLRISSSNSSKPPSSDGPANRASRRRHRKVSGKKAGGQEGHRGTHRERIAADKVDEVVECRAEERCDCGGWTRALHDAEAIRHQVVELPAPKAVVTEYRQHASQCMKCGRKHRGTLPKGVSKSCLGPRAIATVGVLSGSYQLGHRQIGSLLEDMFGVRVSLGTLSETTGRVSEVLSGVTGEMQEAIRTAPYVHMDETGHRRGASKGWLWAQVSASMCVFAIRYSRAKTVAQELLGKTYPGYVITDRYGGYAWVDPRQRQLCWAHLYRDFIRISERSGAAGEVGKALVEQTEQLFHDWHLRPEDYLQSPTWQVTMADIASRISEQLEHGMCCGHKKTERTCKRIHNMVVALWTFTKTEGIEPTNNLAERMIRPYVIWRKRSLFTQSERGDRFIERIMSVHATCKIQGRKTLDFITESVAAWIAERPTPSLLPSAR